MNITFPDNAPFRGRFDYLIVHCTATPASMGEVDALWTDRVHRKKGWSGGGYNAIITRSGELQHETTGHRTRPYSKIGSHVGGCGKGWNARCLGVSLAGGVKEDGRTPEDNFTPQQYNTLDAYIKAVCLAFDIPLDHVIGHRDLIKMTNAAPKACPCFSVQTWLNGLADDDSRLDYGSVDETPRVRDKALRVYRTYTVQDGDTLWGISNATGVPLRTLKWLNKGIDPDMIHVGQKLRLRN